MVEIGVPNFGDQATVNVKVLVDNHNVILDFLDFRFLFVLEGDDVIVMLAHIIRIYGVVTPLGGFAPSLIGLSVVVVDTVGFRH